MRDAVKYSGIALLVAIVVKLLASVLVPVIPLLAGIFVLLLLVTFVVERSRL